MSSRYMSLTFRISAVSLAIAGLAGCGGGGGSSRIGGDESPTVSITANADSVVAGQFVTLAWDSSSVTSCAAGGNWSGSKGTQGKEVVQVNATGDARFALQCQTESGGSVTDEAVVKVLGRVPASIDFDAVTFDVVKANDDVVFTWKADNAERCVASTGSDINSSWTGERDAVGFETVTMPGSPGAYLYSLTCSGKNISETTEQVVINVVPETAPVEGPEITFSQRPAGVIESGVPVTIAWTAAGAAQCTGASEPADAGWNQVLGATDSYTRVFEEPGNYVYSLSCANEQGGTTIENLLFTVRPAGPVVEMAFENGLQSAVMPADGSISFSWEVDTSAESCVATSGDSRWASAFAADFTNGFTGAYTAKGLAPGVYNYNLSCKDTSGKQGVSESLQLTVGNVAPPVGEFTLPVSIEDGWVTVDWVTDGANSCVPYSQNWPEWRDLELENQGLSGPVKVQLPPKADGTHLLDATLVCSGPGNTQTNITTAFSVDYVTITETDADGNPVSRVEQTLSGPAINLSAVPSRVGAGEHFAIVWDSVGADSCQITETVGSGWVAGEVATRGQQGVTAPTEPGVYTYSLSCAAPATQEPTTANVYVVVGNASPVIERFETPRTDVAGGEEITFEWRARNVLFCEGGNSGVEGWTGFFEQSAAGSRSVTLPRRVDDSQYDFALTCGLPGGPKTSDILTVKASSVGNECGVLDNNRLSRLLTNDVVDVRVGSIYSGTGAPVIIGDGESVDENAIYNITDGSMDTYARLTLPLGLLGLFHSYIDVYARPPLQDLGVLTDEMGGNKDIGFLIGNPNQALQLSLLGLDSLSQVTGVMPLADGGVDIETGDRNYDNTNGLELNALYLINDRQVKFLSMPVDETQKLMGVRYALQGGLLAIAKMRDVYGVCVSSDLN
ncbi:hypothetical protein KUV59_10435 [Marinobacter daepoensis]|uniref:hypothetical protein n=1 Tax=Marinobacter daepoensis TaxID=262077 RepID=UPI001C9398AB|nr:hypothetical protein [Marinobacter daepoensis]MBY6033588.1 hypothetical protein [Marinobacter daepoensis]